MKSLNKSNHPEKIEQPPFLPLSPQELRELGWESLDILLVSGDAYVDHPSFGAAILGRWLVEHGFTVAIAAQPVWSGADAMAALQAFPRPRLFAGVTAGSIDSMLAHHTAFRKKRHDDAYTPGGKAGSRPDRATIVYSSLVRQAFPALPLVLGGLEASLRRASHYDFWSDSLRRSILLDSKADIVLYGMGEQSILEVARQAEALACNAPQDERTPKDYFRKALATACRSVRGAVTALSDAELATLNQQQIVTIPAHEEILQDKKLLVKATTEQERLTHQGQSFILQRSGTRNVLLAPPPDENLPPMAPLLPAGVDQNAEAAEHYTRKSAEKPAGTTGNRATALLDKVYQLPFSRLPHPAYAEPIPAWEMIRTSITTHRGCGGGCSFCSLALHQGRALRSRSKNSILEEACEIAAGPTHTKTAKKTSSAPKWAGSISDVGGPSANMWQGSCKFGQENCKRASCLFPSPCPGFQVDQKKCVELLHEVSQQPGVRHVRVASGVRFDMAVEDMHALKAYSMDFTGGQLKVAPEHISSQVLQNMRKPPLQVFERFLDAFAKFSKAAGKEQYVIPYLISAFPGCTSEHMKELKNWLQKRGWSPKQVQCFIPTPGTVATAMYYAECDSKGQALYVAKTDKERMQQHYILLGEQNPRQQGSRQARPPQVGTRPAYPKSKHK